MCRDAGTFGWIEQIRGVAGCLAKKRDASGTPANLKEKISISHCAGQYTSLCWAIHVIASLAFWDEAILFATAETAAQPAALGRKRAPRNDDSIVSH
jgi:hypothetical protein